MSAEEELKHALTWPTGDLADPEATQLVNAYAHELAERQREHLRSQGYDLSCACEGCSACLAKEYIDLVDPGVSDGV